MVWMPRFIFLRIRPSRVRGAQYGRLSMTSDFWDAVELRISLMDYVTILVLKFPLPEASRSMHDSANEQTLAAIAGWAEASWGVCEYLHAGHVCRTF
jgi:hypothetical protein